MCTSATRDRTKSAFLCSPTHRSGRGSFYAPDHRGRSPPFLGKQETTMTTTKINTATAILLTGLLLSACSATQDINVAQEAIAQFHEMMSTGQFEQIYAQSDDSLKKATTTEDLTLILSAINRK